jgi:hypothetical protein
MLRCSGSRGLAFRFLALTTMPIQSSHENPAYCSPTVLSLRILSQVGSIRSFVALPTQQPKLQRRECRKNQAESRIQPLKLALYLLTLQPVVLRLLHNWWDETKLVCDLTRLGNRIRGPLRPVRASPS